MPLRPAIFRSGRRRWARPLDRRLQAYHADVAEQSSAIDRQLASVADTVDALRRRDVEADEGLQLLLAAEGALELAAATWRDTSVPGALRVLHTEYEANLDRTLRGVATAEQGCRVARMRHHDAEGDEPLGHWKRGHLNILHAHLRMQELAGILLTWEPGMPAKPTAAARVRGT